MLVACLSAVKKSSNFFLGLDPFDKKRSGRLLLHVSNIKIGHPPCSDREIAKNASKVPLSFIIRAVTLRLCFAQLKNSWARRNTVIEERPTADRMVDNAPM